MHVDTFFRDFQADSSPFTGISKYYEILNCTKIDNPINHLVKYNNVDLYLDGCKLKDGAGARYILTDPKGNKNLIACRLEFEFMNNTSGYEALIQGLKKSIDMNVQYLKVFGDSEIIVKQVHNYIHCISNHIRKY